MGKVYLLFVICTTFLVQPSTQSTISGGVFCYDDASCGPKSAEWPGVCQNGANQSPINLPHNYATMYLAAMNPRPLNFNGDYSAQQFYIRNNGHSIQISFTPDLNSSAQMTGFGFDNPYTFAQLHFHWGKNILHGGSEHTINGAHLPMEVHFVHYDSKYPSYAAAAASGDPKGLAVIAIFLEPVVETLHLLGPSLDNPAFDTIADNIPVNYQASPQLVSSPLDLNGLLPKTRQTFYRYMGSLTTPGCNEEVEWTVIPDPIRIKMKDYNKFHQVLGEDNLPLSENYRPVQSLGSRTIAVHTKA